MIFRSLVWIAIVAGGSVAGANKWNQLVDEDLKDGLRHYKSKGTVPWGNFLAVGLAPNVDLTQFHPPAELLPKKGDNVATILDCKNLRRVNITNLERRGDVVVDKVLPMYYWPGNKPVSISTPITFQNAYIEYPECHLFWNGRHIFEGAVKITFAKDFAEKEGYKVSYSAQIMKVLSKGGQNIQDSCTLHREIRSGPNRTLPKREVHAYNKDGTNNKVSSYLINHLLDAAPHEIDISYLRLIADVVSNQIINTVSWTKNSPLCVPLASLNKK